LPATFSFFGVIKIWRLAGLNVILFRHANAPDCARYDLFEPLCSYCGSGLV
jgi:hypothetical protein